MYRPLSYRNNELASWFAELDAENKRKCERYMRQQEKDRLARLRRKRQRVDVTPDDLIGLPTVEEVSDE